MICFLVFGNDPIGQAEKCSSMAVASYRFRQVAEELDKLDQSITATVHFAKTWDEVVEHPDRRLRLGPRGRVIIERM